MHSELTDHTLYAIGTLATSQPERPGYAAVFSGPRAGARGWRSLGRAGRHLSCRGFCEE